MAVSSTDKAVELPEWWGLSAYQTKVIQALMGKPDAYHSANELCQIVYGETCTKAPTKLRVLVQKSREALSDLTDGVVALPNVRGLGWRITNKHAKLLEEMMEEYSPE